MERLLGNTERSGRPISLKRSLRWMGTLFVLCGAVGCGRSGDRPELGTVSGIVTLENKPLSGATVLFIPETGRGSSATTDAAGRYMLQYTDSQTGARVGHHIVQISMNASPIDGEVQQDPVPVKYHENSILSADVKPGVNEFNFELEAK